MLYSDSRPTSRRFLQLFAAGCFVLAALLTVVNGIRASYIIGPTSHPITPSTGTPAFVQTAGTSSGAGPTLTLSFGSLPAVAHVVIVAVASNGAAGLDGSDSITDNQSNAYARVNFSPKNTLIRIALWCAPVTTSSGTFTITSTFSAADLATVFALEYSGATCNPEKIADVSSQSTSPYSCGSITTVNARDLLLAFVNTPLSTGTINYTAPTGFTIRQSQGVIATGRTGSIADDIVSATNTFSPAYVADQNLANSSCLVVALISGN